MSTPVNRLSQHYAEAAVNSTVDYIGYCLKRLYPNGGVSWHHRTDHATSSVGVGLARDRHGHAFITRFRVPIDAGGAQIKLLCLEAADALNEMIRRSG